MTTTISPLLAALFLVVGIIGLLAGVLGKEFVKDDGKETPVPRAFGAAMFIAISIPFILFGAWTLYESFRS